ncbi:hypothetical protein KOI35_26980 [Actinoplanes bogorensis]|uniref:Uncharacterized protein n=1 Tax=Paractinoplanes bogorensis TaxID=1610840 RepID=A0ABS5YUM8_9ACTN|nr:hypothetical protein [Actinoplanes bogorensis]MBU2667157.1 hypothetical protein [Actinoplanes bogorensis]
MNDFRARMDRLGGTVEPVSEEAIMADIARGEKAVRQRRTIRAVTGSAFGVAALVATVSLTGVMTNGGSGTPPASAISGGPASTASGLRLVDYTGRQPEGFTVDTVPEGFYVQGGLEDTLTIAPLTPRSPEPVVDPSGQPSGPSGRPAQDDPLVLEGKIGIYLEHKAVFGELTGPKLKVGGKEAVLIGDGAAMTQLVIVMSPEVYAVLQFDVPMSRAQMIEMGAGLHVHQSLIDKRAHVFDNLPKKD